METVGLPRKDQQTRSTRGTHGQLHNMSCYLNGYFKDAASFLAIGSFLLAIKPLYLQLCFGAFLLTIGASPLTFGHFLLTIEVFLLTVGKCV